MKRRDFELRGEAIPVLSLSLHDPSPDQLRRFLNRKIREAPAFFRQAPLLLDLSPLPSPPPLDRLLDICRQLGLMPIGLRGQEELRPEAERHGLLWLGPSRPQQESENRLDKREDKQEEHPFNLLLLEPVRSGQRVYATGDLTVVASVNSGGEVVAGGNLHIYGTLRGRAIAGARGDRTARIFCSRLEAELVAIAGHYLLHEDFPRPLLGRPVQIFLEGDEIRWRELDQARPSRKS